MIPLYKPNRYAKLDISPSFSKDTVSELEDRMVDYLGCEYCVATSSGTSALLALAMYLRGGKAISSFAVNDIHFSGIYSAFKRAGYYLEDDKADIKILQHLGSKTIGISAFEREAENVIVEDACHAFGSKYSDGKMVGSCAYSDFTVFSFHPSKTLTSGEGGLITTNSEEYYNGIKEIINLGKTPGTKDIQPDKLGLNFRMSPVGAQMLMVQLDEIEDILADRREALLYYIEQLRDGGIEFQIPSENTAAHLMIAYLRFRDTFKSEDYGFQTSIHYPLYPYIEKPSALAEYHSKYAISLPMFDTITIGQIREVVDAICTHENLR